MQAPNTKQLTARRIAAAIFAAPLTPVPLPPALVLFGSGLLGMLGFNRRRVAA
jgi:chromate transport protein ChrA